MNSSNLLQKMALATVSIQWQSFWPQGEAGPCAARCAFCWFVDDGHAVNVSDDPVACCVNLVHRVGEEVTGGSLDEIFGELSAIGFDRVPRSVSAHHNIRRHPESHLRRAQPDRN